MRISDILYCEMLEFRGCRNTIKIDKSEGKQSRFQRSLYEVKKNLPRGSILPDPRKEARLNRRTTLENAGYVSILYFVFFFS